MNTGKARGVYFIDTETGKTYEARAKVVILGASTLESARSDAALEIQPASQWHRQFQRPRGPQFLRTHHGAGRQRIW